MGEVPLLSLFYLGCTWRALAILYQLRAVSLNTGCFLHMVLHRIHCRCWELGAVGRAYLYLLPV